MTRSDIWIGAGIATLSIALYSLSLRDANFYAAENGVLEMLQLMVIAAFALTYAWAATQQGSALRTAAIAMAGLGVIFFIRELDFKLNPNTPLLAMLTGRGWRDGVFFGALAILAGYCYLRRAHAQQWLALMRRRTSWPFAVGIAFLGLGHLLDDLWVNNDTRRFWEELAELIGFLLLLVAAVRHVSLVDFLPAGRSIPAHAAPHDNRPSHGPSPGGR